MVLGMGGSKPTSQNRDTGYPASWKPRSQKRDLGHPNSWLHKVGDWVGEQVETVEQALEGGLGAGEGVAAFAGDGDEALGATSALGCGAAVAEGDEALVLHAVQRGVERAGGRIAAGFGGDFGEDGDAVGLVAEAQDGEENDLLKFAEGTIRAHMDYKVVLTGANVNPILRAPELIGLTDDPRPDRASIPPS